MFIEPMLAKTFDKDKNAEKIIYPCFVQPKIDGVRMVWDTENFYSRNGKHLYIPQGMKDELCKHFYNLKLDGELLIPGDCFDKVSGEVRKGWNYNDNIRYYVFDIPDTQSPQVSRLRTLDSIFHEHSFKYVQHVPNKIVESSSEIQEEMEEYVSEGYEGVIIRNMHAKYQTKRTFHLQKLKPWKFEVVTAIQVVEGEGCLRGTMGCLKFIDKYGVEGTVGTGFSDEERAFWYKTDRNCYIRIKYQEKTLAGKTRLPVFVEIVL
jgi:DNA ligase-1